MGRLLCEKNLRDVWCRNDSVRAEIGPILQTNTHTHTRVSYSSIDTSEMKVYYCPTERCEAGEISQVSAANSRLVRLE